MSKIKLNQLGVLPDNKMQVIQIGESSIEVFERVAYEDLFRGMQWSLNQLIDNRPFVSEPLKRIVETVGFLRIFTNLDFAKLDLAEFDVNEMYELYDIITVFDIVNKVNSIVQAEQRIFYYETLTATIKSIIDYRNSAAGTIELITTKEKDTSGGITEALTALQDPNNMEQVQKMFKLMNIDPENFDLNKLNGGNENPPE